MIDRGDYKTPVTIVEMILVIVKKNKDFLILKIMKVKFFFYIFKNNKNNF